MRWRSSRFAIAIAIAVVVAVPGCGGVPGGGARLEVGLAEGGLTIPDDGSQVREATLGGGLLCTTGGPVTIRSITYETPVPPTEIEDFVRSVDEPSSVQVDAVAGLPGTPEDFMSEPNPGTLHGAEGYEVTSKCSDGSSSHEFSELLIGASASEQGAIIDGMVVEYESAGRVKTVDVSWTYTFCGTLVENEECVGDGI